MDPDQDWRNVGPYNGSQPFDTLIEFLKVFCEKSQQNYLRVGSMKLTLYLLYIVPSADYLRKQFGPGSGPTKRRSWSGFKPFDTLIEILKGFFLKSLFRKKSADDNKSMNNYRKFKELRDIVSIILNQELHLWPKAEGYSFGFVRSFVCLSIIQSISILISGLR